MENNKISVALLEQMEACSEGIEWFEENYGETEYTVSEIIQYSKDNNIKPDHRDVRWLIQYLQFCQTMEMLEYYKSLGPDYSNVSWLIAHCKYCQTKEMIRYYKSLIPPYVDISWLIGCYRYCQTPEIKKILLESTDG